MAKLRLSEKVWYTITAILLALCITFAVLWGMTLDKANHGNDVLEKLCKMSATYASDSLHIYERKGEDAAEHFLSGMADYNVFLSTYYNLFSSDESAVADYMVCFDIYNYMLTSPDIVKQHVHPLVHALEKLETDLRSKEAMDGMQMIRDNIKAEIDAAKAAESEESVNTEAPDTEEVPA